ncbi:hypothetical protein [Lentiprolixibacter aurantiacus]|uniref:DUF4468 domain-containing protein n=1 Tax=Lentiprolixibacter aurantiacus TaxID=2993939 RepID=A0AAE3MI71_9FLAO|nr:hypothetical protein [Lentiprolixibacter aurantiacus]MCX2717971.1 hypothetical protein [Lentiprolixibacter aurantiacus]
MRLLSKTIFSAILLQAIIVNAQVSVNLPSAYIQNQLDESGIPKNVVGSAYDTENFKYGSVLVKGSESYKALLRYNGFRDQIEMKSSDNSITVLMKRNYISARINNELITIRKFEDEGRERQGYFSVIAQHGDFELLQRRQIILKEAQQASSSYAKDKPARFEKDYNYYLQYKEDGVAKKVRLSKKSVIDALPAEYQDKANALCKENKWKLKTEAEVGLLLQKLIETT